MRCIFVSLESKVYCLPFQMASIEQIVVFTNDKTLNLKGKKRGKRRHQREKKKNLLFRVWMSTLLFSVT